MQTSGELVEYMESQLDKYARDRDAGGRPPEVAVRSLGLPQSPRTPEGAGRLERLLRRTPCGNPDRIVDSRCFTSPRKRGTYDRLCVEMHGKPLRIDAGPSTPPPLRVAAPLNFGSYTNPGKYPPSPSSKIWGYTRASSSPNIFAPSRGRLPPRDSLGSPSAEDSIADRRLQGAT